MKEILMIADRITVLRDGYKVKTISCTDATHDKLAQMMIGRNIETLFMRPNDSRRSVMLKVENLSRVHVFQDISFEVHTGEVLGFAGLVGSGRTEIARAIFGVDPLDAGTIYVDSQAVAIKSPSDAIGHGIGLIPEDRKEQGLVLGMTIKENTTLAILKKLSTWGIINRKHQRNLIHEFIRKLQIKITGIEQKVQSLSGGNQQKVVISKWLAQQPKILILDEPTRGIDVGAKAEIYGLINTLAHQGMAILLISSELPEILGICDRILILSYGRLVGELASEEATEEKIMRRFIGGMEE
jgi:ribose transport system ATP-binding protein